MKRLLFLLLLVIGPLACSVSEEFGECPDFDPYLKVEGMHAVAQLKGTNTYYLNGQAIKPRTIFKDGDYIDFEMTNFYTELKVSYFSQNENKGSWLNPALAESPVQCEYNGEYGSPDQYYTKVDIFTEFDLDADHSAGSSVSDLFYARTSCGELFSTQDFFDPEWSPLGSSRIFNGIRFDTNKIKPEADQEIQFRIEIEINSDTTYILKTPRLIQAF